MPAAFRLPLPVKLEEATIDCKVTGVRALAQYNPYPHQLGERVVCDLKLSIWRTELRQADRALEASAERRDLGRVR